MRTLVVSMRIYDDATGHYVSKDLRLSHGKDKGNLNKIVDTYTKLCDDSELYLKNEEKVEVEVLNG